MFVGVTNIILCTFDKYKELNDHTRAEFIKNILDYTFSEEKLLSTTEIKHITGEICSVYHDEAKVRCLQKIIILYFQHWA